ncbi:MAG: type I secretion system permease/ATPase [Pseudomonadota bacterium]
MLINSRIAPSRELHEAFAALRPWLRRSLLFTLIAGLLILAPSVYMLEVYDRVVNSRNPQTLLMLTLAVVFAFVVMQVLEWAHDEEMHAAGLQLDRRLGARVFAASFEANLRALPSSTTQPLADLRFLREFLTSPVLKAALESPVSLVFLVVIFAIHPLLGWAAGVGALVQLAIALLNNRATHAQLSAAQRSAQAAQRYADGALRNAQAVAAMGLLGDIRRRWATDQSEFLQLQAKASLGGAVFVAGAKLVQVAWASLLLGLACWLLLRDELTGGAAMLIVASILGGQMLRPLTVAVGHWRTALQAGDAWLRLAALLASVPPAAEQMALPPPRGQLQAENLVVTPPGAHQPVLRGVSFSLRPGEVLGVIGPSAAGKSCLARALVGLWPSTGGKARLDGVDLHAWNKAQLGPHIGYLPQEVELSDGTIADNIARFGPFDQARLDSVAHTVGLHEFIRALPDGWGTEVGNEGARLSGGQRQRIGLARALYAEPAFVVLDEPNASLDDAGDAALIQAIQDAKTRGATVVVVTHRVSLMPVVDKLLWLSEGAVQAFGPRDQVLAATRRATRAARPMPTAAPTEPVS